MPHSYASMPSPSPWPYRVYAVDSTVCCRRGTIALFICLNALTLLTLDPNLGCVWSAPFTCLNILALLTPCFASCPQTHRERPRPPPAPLLLRLPGTCPLLLLLLLLGAPPWRRRRSLPVSEAAMSCPKTPTCWTHLGEGRPAPPFHHPPPPLYPATPPLAQLDGRTDHSPTYRPFPPHPSHTLPPSPRLTPPPLQP